MLTTQGRLATGFVIAAVGATLMLAMAKSGRADDSWSPYYIGLGVDSEHRENAVDRAGPYTVFNQGIGGSLQFGRHLTKIIDVEAEMNDFDNSDQKEVVPAIPADAPVIGPLHNGQNAWGNINLQSYMFNVVGNIPIKTMPKLKPFVAAGLGIYQSQVHGLSSAGLDSTTFGDVGTEVYGYGAPFVLDTNSDWQTAYQFKGGLAYKADPHTEVLIDVRRFLGDRFELQSNNPLITGNTGQLHVNGPRITAVEVGIRIEL
ncbi:MAG: outer membrane beta-barrel protein [Capsulimonadaceae bacterium]